MYKSRLKFNSLEALHVVENNLNRLAHLMTRVRIFLKVEILLYTNKHSPRAMALYATYIGRARKEINIKFPPINKLIE